MAVLVFIFLFIPAFFIALIKGSIMYSASKYAKALKPSYFKALGCFLAFYIMVIIYIIMTGKLELDGFLKMCLADGLVYIVISLILIEPFAISGMKNIFSFIIGGLFTNLLFMVFLTVLFFALISNTIYLPGYS